MESTCPLALPPWDWASCGVQGNARNKIQSIPDPSLRGRDPIPDLAQVWRQFRAPLNEAGRSHHWASVAVSEEHVWRLSSWKQVLIYLLGPATVHVKILFPWWGGSYLGFLHLRADWCHCEVGSMPLQGQGTAKACPYTWGHRGSSVSLWAIKLNKTAWAMKLLIYLGGRLYAFMSCGKS